MYSSTMLSPPSSTEKFLSLEEQCTNDQISEGAIDRILSEGKSSRWSLFQRHVLIHAGLLTIYTAIVFSFWPQVTTEGLAEVYSEHNLLRQCRLLTTIFQQAQHCQQCNGSFTPSKILSKRTILTKDNPAMSSTRPGTNFWLLLQFAYRRKTWIESTGHPFLS